MAECRNFDAGLVRGLQHRRAFLGADLLAVNGQSFGSHKNYFVAGSGCFAAPLECGPNGSDCSSASYSLRKNRSVLMVGFGGVWPRPHKLVLRTMSQSSSSFARSRAVALRLAILSSRLCICTVPARQGTHLPQDSSMQNSMKKRAISTMFVVWSITIMPPEPMIEPSLPSDS